MRSTIKDINAIIELCYEMISYIKAKGKIYPGNKIYNEYKSRIYR